MSRRRRRRPYGKTHRRVKKLVVEDERTEDQCLADIFFMLDSRVVSEPPFAADDLLAVLRRLLPDQLRKAALLESKPLQRWFGRLWRLAVASGLVEPGKVVWSERKATDLEVRDLSFFFDMCPALVEEVTLSCPHRGFIELWQAYRKRERVIAVLDRGPICMDSCTFCYTVVTRSSNGRKQRRSDESLAVLQECCDVASLMDLVAEFDDVNDISIPPTCVRLLDDGRYQDEVFGYPPAFWRLPCEYDELNDAAREWLAKKQERVRVKLEDEGGAVKREADVVVVKKERQK